MDQDKSGEHGSGSTETMDQEIWRPRIRIRAGTTDQDKSGEHGTGYTENTDQDKSGDHGSGDIRIL